MAHDLPRLTKPERAILEEFAKNDRPLGRAIAKALLELDSLPRGGSYRRLVRNLVRQSEAPDGDDN